MTDDAKADNSRAEIAALQSENAGLRHLLSQAERIIRRYEAREDERTKEFSQTQEDEIFDVLGESDLAPAVRARIAELQSEIMTLRENARLEVAKD